MPFWMTFVPLAFNSAGTFVCPLFKILKFPMFWNPFFFCFLQPNFYFSFFLLFLPFVGFLYEVTGLTSGVCLALVGSRAMWSVVDSSVPQFFFSVTPESAPPPPGAGWYELLGDGQGLRHCGFRGRRRGPLGHLRPRKRSGSQSTRQCDDNLASLWCLI